MPASGKDIVIAGGGATGVSAVIALATALAVRPPGPGVTLHLFDPDGFGNGGIAYGKSGAALLNDAADAMSPWNPGAFVAWAARNGFGSDPKAFHERRVYGAFLQDEYRQAKRILRAVGVKVAEHREAVTGIARGTEDTFTIFGSSSVIGGVPRENIVIAPGYGKSEAFAALDKFAQQGYVGSLYPPQALESAIAKKPGAKILAIGTGPALYDLLRMLPGQFHGTIDAISSSGMVPVRRDVSVEGSEARWSLTAEYNRVATADELSALIAHDLSQAEANGSTVRRTALDIQKELKTLLGQLDQNEQKKFVRGSLAKLFHAATPVPDVSWRQKSELEKQGRFAVRTGRISPADIVPDGDGFLLGGEHFDVIVNCAGHDPLNQRLVKTLLQGGLAQEDEGLHLLKTKEDGFHLAGSGLAVIGPATHVGLHGVESFYGPAAAAAQAIAASLAYVPQPVRAIFPVPASGPLLRLQPGRP